MLKATRGGKRYTPRPVSSERLSRLADMQPPSVQRVQVPVSIRLQTSPAGCWVFLTLPCKCLCIFFCLVTPRPHLPSPPYNASYLHERSQKESCQLLLFDLQKASEKSPSAPFTGIPAPKIALVVEKPVPIDLEPATADSTPFKPIAQGYGEGEGKGIHQPPPVNLRYLRQQKVIEGPGMECL